MSFELTVQYQQISLHPKFQPWLFLSPSSSKWKISPADNVFPKAYTNSSISSVTSSENRSAATKINLPFLSQEAVGSTLAKEKSMNIKGVIYSEKWRDRRAFTEGLEMLADTPNKKEWKVIANTLMAGTSQELDKNWLMYWINDLPENNSKVIQIPLFIFGI